MSLRFFQNKMLNISTRRSSFTISVVCGIFASFSIAPRGVECYSFTCNPPPPPVASVQELVHRSEVVFEGKLQEKGREYDINQNEREILYRERAKAKLNLSEEQSMNRQFDHLRALDPNATSDAEPRQVRVRVHQVWEIKAGGLEKNSVVSLVWYQTDNCFQLSTGTRYMFFMEPTNDTSVFIAVFPPVETKRAVRKDVSKVLCQECAEPKLKGLKSGMVEEGRKTLLKCEIVAGNPTPNIKWYKNGIELVGKNKPKDIRIKKKKQGKISELHLRKASQSHTGTYKCEATNNLGKVSTTANLTVNRVPTSTTPPVKTSSHVTRCSESEKNYCVNGGECFTLEVTPGSTKFLCRCPNEFTGDRCQNYVMANFYKHLGIEFMEAEELYQKRVLTITGICIALLVVGIMCVVAYCKTKKQRKKLHDRLRQSLRERNAMASMANGPQLPIPPPDNLQLVNQYVSKNAIPAQHVIEKETETSFSTSQYTSSNHQSTTVTHTSSQCWSNGKKESVMSDNRSVLVMSSAENSRHGTPSHRGRLNATGGARDLSAYLKSSRETPDSYRDSPYSERYVSAVTTPTHTSSMNLLSPVTPSSPPSETSAPLSSLAASVPSVAPSPSGEEERPLLFISPPWLRDRQRQEQSGGQYQRNSAHYNHGLEDPSPPPSPLRIVEDDEYESTQEYDGANAATPQSPSDKLANGRRAKRTKASGPEATEAAGPAGGSNSESNSSESETEDERVGEDTPFLSIQIPAVGSLEGDSSRTNPALRLSPQDDLQARLANVMANQDPIAV